MTARSLGAVLLLLAFASLSLSNACIYKYGTSRDSLSPPHGGSHWDHGLSGDDWNGVDASGKPWICMTGKKQSPIDVPPMSQMAAPTQQIPFELRTRWNYSDLVSNGSNIEVINNGHTIQIEWLYDYPGKAEIAVPASWTNETKVTSVLRMSSGYRYTHVTAKPLQFHFHTTSEHTFNSRYFPLEMHIVHKVTDLPACASGCYSVTGIVFEVVDGPDNPLLDAIWAAMPIREGQVNFLRAGKKIQLGYLIPHPAQRHYVTYEGSLTTPPCTEGLLWHVMLTPQKISISQWQKYKIAVGLKNCELENAIGTAGHDDDDDHTHAHHRHHHHRLSSRRLLVEEVVHGEAPAGNPEDWNCTLVAYGTNFRTFQKINSRPVKLLHM